MILKKSNGKQLSNDTVHLSGEHFETAGVRQEASAQQEHLLVIIDGRALDRQCLAQSIVAHKAEIRVLALGSIEEWRQRHSHWPKLSAILLNIGGRKASEPTVAEEIRRLSSEFEPAPVIVLADTDELGQIMKALECGAKGYIPSSVSVDVCIEAVYLALAGGIFVPASSVFAMRQLLETSNTAARPLAGMFTARQAEVVEALRRGKANKIIAYELNLRESTVKVHIRNIMKKIKATNRTEVAYKINDLFPGDPSADGSSQRQR
ncbi:LuxR C-terminal-related transcriptional regulator [Ensifer sp. 2YAB10]|uniref:helix-turn-helix transcriptional regulator n=1 Tax=unclassified Ensifer TaxID=2633371 RepID=UPI003F92EA93